MNHDEFSVKIKTYVEAIDLKINDLFNEVCRTELYDSMKYSLSCGGKRIRPVLMLAFTEALGKDPMKVLDFACGIEMIHTYSLIHDDLPCMDDDDLRRGKPSNHIRYGYAEALLAGDALLNAAFESMADSSAAEPDLLLKAISYVGKCSGRKGMILGQSCDLKDMAKSVEERLSLSSLKTGCLLKAPCVAAMILAGKTDADSVELAETYGNNLGLAFQIRDDILDVTGSPVELGKNINCDKNKTTFVSLCGLEQCEKTVLELTEEAIKAVSSIDNTGFLTMLAQKLAFRIK